MSHISKLEGYKIKVVAPIPYHPSFKIGKRWIFSQVLPYQVVEGIEVYHPRYFMIPKIGMSLHGIMMFLSALKVIGRIQKEFNFDIIDAHYVYPDGFAAILLGIVFGKPTIVSARGTDINLFKQFFVIRRLLQYTLKKANGVIAVSQALRSEMIRLGISQDKISVVPNGVDQNKFYPVSKQAVRRQLGLPDKRIILSVGNLVPNKGMVLLISALKLLVEKHRRKDFYLIIIGNGVQRRDLEKKISLLGLKDQVRLMGSVAHQDLNLWYNAADLFCLASSREGWPNVILEALACGIPVIATGVGGIPEIIQSKELGILTGRDENSLAEAILQGMDRSWDSCQITQYAKKYTWDQTAKSVAGVFESIIRSKLRLSSGSVVDARDPN